MSTLNDLQDNNLKDFALLEKLFWLHQEGKISAFVMRSYGNYGRYVLDVVESEDGFVYRNGKKTDTKIAHFAQFMTEQMDAKITKIALRSGFDPMYSDGKAQTKRPSTVGDMFSAFDTVLAAHPVNKDPKHINSWIRMWHVGLASLLGLINGKIETLYRNEVGLGGQEKWNFVLSHTLTHSPTTMRKAYEKVLAEKAQERKAAKAKEQESAPVTAMATAMESAKAKVSENGK